MNNIMKKIIFGIALIGSMLSFGEETYTFTNPDEVGTFTVPNGQYAKAEILLVGGGGAGGTVGQDVIQGAAGGGGAGGVSHREVILEGGTYFVNVGRGGQKAQDLTHSWVGDDGEYTTLAFNNSTNFISTVKGGGGGGSVKIGGNGTPGASGGGGSWYGEFMNGGSGTDGYGWNGGTPTDINIGGGGGGAGSTGKADGTPGDGKEVWNVIYARGGRGGNRGEQNYEPKDGEGYGFGGDGAVNGLGCKGGDGIVIIKIIKTFTYTEVKIPVDGEQGYTFSFPSNGTNRVGFDLTKASTNLRNGVEVVEGVTNATDLGHYKFTIYLKDEHRWEDGTTEPKTFGWRINEPNVVGNITVDVKKTVDWFEGTNATIAIDIHSTPETKVFIPNVLVLGSLCDAHDLTADIVRTTLNTVTEVGNVDYYYFNESANTASLSGSLSKGQKFTKTVTVKTSNHWTAYGFYNQLWTLINNGTAEKYDYIIFSFDRSRVVGKYTTAHSHEADVANFLIPYYESGKVIWLVDKDPANYSTTQNNRTYTIEQTPWYPCDLYPYTSGNTTSWRTFRQHISDATQAYTAYHGMIGLFSPMDYERITRTVWNSGNLGDSLNYSDVANVGKVAGQKNPNQVVYDNADNVADVISSVVKPTVATIEAHDQIYIKNGLKINSDLTDAYYTTNALLKDMTWEQATSSWTKLNSNELKYSDENGIELAISNVTSEAWVKLKIGVTDTGKFLTSVGAKWNERTGKWEKDPNNGPVKVEMMPDNGTKVIAEDEATTTVEWSFEAFKITGNVLYGEGDFIINGFETNEISVAKGYNPEAMFRGAPGWAVCYIEVDGQIIDDNHYMTNWFFGQISSDHDIKVAFTNIMVNPPPPEVGPTTQMYDGEGHTLEVLKDPTFLEGYEEYSNHWYMVYTTDPNADPTDRSAWTTTPPITNVVYDAKGNPAPQTVYARVCLEQPGYEDGAIVPYWCGTNTVTILPREITIEYDDAVQTSSRRVTEFNYHVVDGELVNGDSFNIESGNVGAGKCTNHPTKGSKTEDSVTKGDGLDIISKDGTTGNYVIKVKPGDYYYPDLDLVGTAPDVTHVYDGNLYSTEATVAYPIDAKTTPIKESDWSSEENEGSTWNPRLVSTKTVTGSTLTIEYFADGNWTTTPPEFKEVGSYDVEYRINYTVIDETITRVRTSRWTQNYTYTTNSHNLVYHEYSDVAHVTITPRDLTIVASSDKKIYDGTPLTNSNYTITGLVNGETINAHMTSDSTIISIGSTPNKVDYNYTHNSKFNPNNYNITFVDGTLTIVDIENGGGSDDYLDESKALMIVDHEACADGWVYLAFTPQFKTIPHIDINVWVERTASNKGFKFKYGRTREDCESCNPVSVELSEVESHVADIKNNKIWVKVPLKNITNIASYTEDLIQNIGFVRLFVAGKADEWKYKYAEPQDVMLSSEGATSINRFGILRNDSVTTNTMIAIPWTWYSETEETATDIPTRKLVKETFLSEGDTLLQFTQAGTYAAWYMFDNEW